MFKLRLPAEGSPKLFDETEFPEDATGPEKVAQKEAEAASKNEGSEAVPEGVRVA